MSTPGESSLWRGVQATAIHSDLATELGALAGGCSVFLRPVDALMMTGEDRARFLNGQVTCDVGALTDDGGTFGFIATLKGRVEAEIGVLAVGDAFWIELPPATAEAVRERLGKYVLVDRVELSPLGRQVVTVAGPTASDVLAGLVGELPEAVHDHRDVQIGSVAARLVRDPDLAGPTYSLWVGFDDVDTATAALVDGGAVPVGHRAWDTHRVEAARPLWGVDFGVDHFPQETGLGDEAVSYTKGCYLGQEVIARIHYRGGVQRRLRGLKIDGDAATGDPLQLDGKTVGTLGSVVDSPRLGRIGLAIVHDKAEPGSTITVAADGDDRGTAMVVELPFR